MSLAKLQNIMNTLYKNMDNAGKARRAKIQGSSVLVDGKIYPVNSAVPVNLRDGKYVYVHISNNNATVIGE